MPSRRFLGIGLLFVPLATTLGCSMPKRAQREPIPVEIRDARLIDAGQTEAPYVSVEPEMIAALKRSLQHSNSLVANDRHPPAPINILALSGGGVYGAFDVGVLNGWTESGKRPVFDVVTGVSTGALIATYAFLGPQYDEKLRDYYVLARREDIYRKRPWISILSSDSVASSEPLKNKIDEAITQETLDEVAKAHAQGRRLFLGTTNLDTRRFVIWDMGAIASSNKPDALELYRKIILASGSIPGFFPPVLIDVEINGKKYQELHVDGGTTASVFVPVALSRIDLNKPCRRPGSHVYVINSGKLYADSNMVTRRFTKITFDAITAMLHAEARNNIFRVFNETILCGMEFHLMAIPQTFRLNLNGLSFEPRELRRLYELGREMGQSQKGWRETPPGSEANEQTVPRIGTQFRTEE
jgi:hypothetical protein